MTFATTFQRMRQLAGNPALTCVKPRSQWTATPSGYTFDVDYDLFINGAGAQWLPTSTSDLNAVDYVTVQFLPTRGRDELALVAAGLVQEGSQPGYVLPGDIATLQAAQWLELGGVTYTLGEQTAVPAGNPDRYSVRLNKK